MTYSLYGSWAIEDTHAIGKRFIGKCITNNGYEHNFSVGSEYELEITPRILPMSPLCMVLDNGVQVTECHLERFEKLDEV